MLFNCFATELKDATVMVLSPGWVATDMGNKAARAFTKPTAPGLPVGIAPVTKEQSVTGLTAVIAGASHKDGHLKFLHFDGSELPW